MIIYQSAYQIQTDHHERWYHSWQHRMWQFLIPTLAGLHSVHRSVSDDKWRTSCCTVLTQCRYQSTCVMPMVTGMTRPVLPAGHCVVASLLMCSDADGHSHRPLWRHQSAADCADSPSRRQCRQLCHCCRTQFPSTPAAAAHSWTECSTENTAQNQRLSSVTSHMAAPETIHRCNWNTHIHKIQRQCDNSARLIWR